MRTASIIIAVLCFMMALQPGKVQSRYSVFKYSANTICFGVLGVIPVDSSDCVSKLTYFKNLSTKVMLFNYKLLITI